MTFVRIFGYILVNTVHFKKKMKSIGSVQCPKSKSSDFENAEGNLKMAMGSPLLSDKLVVRKITKRLN